MPSQEEKNKTLKEELKEQITDNCIEELMITKQHIDELKDTVSELQSEIDKYKDLLQRKQAEFINFKKRVTIEKENLSKYAIEKLIEELLPVVDGLEKAIETSETNKSLDGLKEGILMVEKLLKSIFTKNGVIPIESLNKEFDPNYHEAMQVQESDEYDTDTVIREWQKGYMLGDKVLRHSKVSVMKSTKPHQVNNIQEEKSNANNTTEKPLEEQIDDEIKDNIVND